MRHMSDDSVADGESRSQGTFNRHQDETGEFQAGPNPEKQLLRCDGCGKHAQAPRLYVTKPRDDDERTWKRHSRNFWTLPDGWMVTGPWGHDESEFYVCSRECAEKAAQERDDQ